MAQATNGRSGPKIGFALSSEEQRPLDLVRYAQLAEERGFEFAVISDHFHPWIDRQGNAPFVWAVLGGIARATSRLWLGTGVTCPTIRMHPVIVAQAAATMGAMMPGRFFLGVGTGEALNEHVTGAPWPEWEVRAEMLEEAVAIIRRLWTGEQVSHRGRHFTVSNARIYTLPGPGELPPIYVAASGQKMARLAGRIGDGLIGTGPDREVIEGFKREAGPASSPEGSNSNSTWSPKGSAGGRPTLAQVTVCWARTEAEARRTALEWWPTVAIHGEATSELPLPAHFEGLAKSASEEDVASMIVCGPSVERMVERVRAYMEAGFDHVYLHQVGPDQEGFLEFAGRELVPVLRGLGAPREPVSGGARR